VNKNLLNGSIKSVPRKWTEENIQELLELKKTKSIKDISILINRTETSIRIKLKRLKKTDDTYNDKHREDKYKMNRIFINEINPETILDVYAGYSYYKNTTKLKVVDNDINGKETDFNLDSFDLLVKFRKRKFDLVDLDPYGSAFNCFDLALQIAQKGLIITFGEYGHKRWRRSDYVKHRYNIQTYKDFYPSNFNKYIIERAKIYNKDLSVFISKDYGNIARTYFKIKHIKKSVSGKEYYL
jgi:tRNA G26 N,N-dimethylase Trm1